MRATGASTPALRGAQAEVGEFDYTELADIPTLPELARWRKDLRSDSSKECERLQEALRAYEEQLSLLSWARENLRQCTLACRRSVRASKRTNLVVARALLEIAFSNVLAQHSDLDNRFVDWLEVCRGESGRKARKLQRFILSSGAVLAQKRSRWLEAASINTPREPRRRKADKPPQK